MADISSVKLPDASEYDVRDETALHSSDPVNNLNSTSTSLPLAANMGHAIGDNLAANENVYGAKNLLSYPYEETTKTENGVTFTDNGDGTISVVASSGATADTYFGLHYPYITLYVKKGTYILSGCPTGGSEATYYLSSSYANDTGEGITVTEFSGDYRAFLIVIKSGTVISTPITFKPMLRDARVIDPTFAPFAKTNLQLTNDKAERADIATINVTGSTNTTGAQIDAGTFFYLNGSLCKALTNIAANATFTLNTNYEEVTVGGELANMAFHKIVENGTYSTVTADTWEYTGVSFTIPAKTFYGLRGESGWQNGRPTGLAISVANDALRTYECLALYEDANGAAYCSATGYSAANLTVYLWSKRQGTGSNPYTLNGWYVNE